MNNVYILSNKGKLSKTGNHLIFSDSYDNKKVIFLFQTKTIIADAPISVTADAFKLLSDNHIQLIFHSSQFSNNFSFSYFNTSDFTLKQTQYNLLNNNNALLSIAKKIVEGKLLNQVSFIQRIKRTKLNNAQKQDICNKEIIIKKYIEKARNSSSLSELRGYEGISAKEYFSVLKHHIKPSWAIFTKRRANPPTTNVNATLSYIYTLLTNKITCLLQVHGFDCMVGIFHSPNQGKPVLAYDLVEEYRASIADPLCCSLFNLGILKENDFYIHEGNSIYLTKNGKIKVIQTYEKKLSSYSFYPPLNRNLTYSDIMNEQIIQFKNTLLNNNKSYMPYRNK